MHSTEARLTALRTLMRRVPGQPLTELSSDAYKRFERAFFHIRYIEVKYNDKDVIEAKIEKFLNEVDLSDDDWGQLIKELE